MEKKLMKQPLQLDGLLITCGFSKQDDMLIDDVMIVQSIKKAAKMKNIWKRENEKSFFMCEFPVAL